MDTNAPGSPKRARATQRQLEALRLRTGGLSYAAIGKHLGISVVAAYGLVQRALKDIAEKTSEQADALRAMELERLDVAQAAIWPKVEQGDVQAIDRLLKIMARRAAYTGIDAPIKQELTGANGGPLQIAAIDRDTAERELAEWRQKQIEALSTLNAAAIPDISSTLTA